MGELKHLNNITPNAELNPYREAAGRAAEIAALYGSKATAVRDMDVDTAWNGSLKCRTEFKRQTERQMHWKRN